MLGKGASEEKNKDIAKIVYGVLAVGLIWTFAGTVLGGIWADQSWGRFWGWDPKENGALLIVIWGAILKEYLPYWGFYPQRFLSYSYFYENNFATVYFFVPCAQKKDFMSLFDCSSSQHHQFTPSCR